MEPAVRGARIEPAIIAARLETALFASRDPEFPNCQTAFCRSKPGRRERNFWKQRPEAKNPPERPLLSAETGNLKIGMKNPRSTELATAVPTRLTRYPSRTQNLIMRAGYAHADAAIRASNLGALVAHAPSFQGIPVVKP